MPDMLRFRAFALLLCSCVCTSELSASGQITQLDDGTISGGEYHNSELGFRYQFPDGWVVNNKATQRKSIEGGHQMAWTDDTSATQCTKNLLFVTQHPEGMPVNGFDSAVFLAAVDPKCFSGVTFPSSVRDKAATQQVAKQIMIHFKTATVSAHSPARVRAFDNAGRVMIEISQALNISINEPTSTTTQSIHSSILLMQAAHYWVIWRFVSDTDYNLDKLRAGKIFFDAGSGATVEPK